MKELIAVCGLDCEKCDAYIATKNNDNVLREKTAKLWSEYNGVEITPDMINCEGCRLDGAKTPYCSDLCPIRKCAGGKSHATCADCAEMEKCQTVRPVISNNPEALNNLKNK